VWLFYTDYLFIEWSENVLYQHTIYTIVEILNYLYIGIQDLGPIGQPFSSPAFTGGPRATLLRDPYLTLLILLFQTKVGGTEPGGSFEEVLSSTAQASSQDTGPTHNLTDTTSRPC